MIPEHCIEALREMLMCAGDMTPLPLKWSEVGNRWNPDFAVVRLADPNGDDFLCDARPMDRGLGSCSLLGRCCH